MTDSEDHSHEDDWSPDKEKSEDPLKMAKELFELAKGQYTKPAPDALQYGYPVGRAVMPFDRVFHVRDISNGFIASHLQAKGAVTRQVETYCNTLGDVTQAFIVHVSALTELKKGDV